MKERGRSFEEIYRDLVQISEEGADIYGSQLVQDILGAGRQTSAAEVSASLLKMQLEQEWFLRQGEDGLFWSWDDASDLTDRLHRSVCECLGRRLERYHREARKGALLALMDRLDGMGGGQLRTQGERAVSVRLPEGELIALAAERAQRHAGELWKGYEEDGTEGREQGVEQVELPARTSLSGTAAALAVAAYADCRELRRNPELLADVSAAAAGLAHVPRQETAKTAAYMALLIAAVSLAEPTEAARPAAAGADFRERAAAFFGPYRQLFAAELRLMLGAGAAELLTEAAAAARSLGLSRREMAHMDQAMDSVAGGETEQDSEKEKENSEAQNSEKQNSEEENPVKQDSEEWSLEDAITEAE